MTKNAKLKKSIRARAKKTGESYAAARRQVLMARDRAVVATSTSAGAVSDAKTLEKTGHDLPHWFRLLDDWGGADKGHKAMAKHLGEHHGVSAWYAQSITVAYERARGLRKLGQVCDGSFQVSVSRVMPVSLDEVVAALGRKAQRGQWLDEGDEATAARLEALFSEEKKRLRRDGHRARLRFEWDGAKVELEITDKDDGRSKALVTMTKLADKTILETRRAGWRSTLDALRAHLKSG